MAAISDMMRDLSRVLMITRILMPDKHSSKKIHWISCRPNGRYCIRKIYRCAHENNVETYIQEMKKLSQRFWDHAGKDNEPREERDSRELACARENTRCVSEKSKLWNNTNETHSYTRRHVVQSATHLQRMQVSVKIRAVVLQELVERRQHMDRWIGKYSNRCDIWPVIRHTRYSWNRNLSNNT